MGQYSQGYGIPQELIDTILYELSNDVDSLKSCSLAASILRGTSQRILLCSFTLDGWAWCLNPFSSSPTNYIAVSNLLQESPHIASYITELDIRLPLKISVITAEHQECFQRILGNSGLVNVRQCHVQGYTSIFRWSELNPVVSSALLEFLPRQPLCELFLEDTTKMPLVAFLQFLAAAPVLSLSSVSIAEGDDNDLLALRAESKLTHLTLDGESKSICEVLSRSRVASYTASLVSLEIVPNWVHSSRLISSVASTLQHICFISPNGTAPPLPLLPALCSMEIILYIGGHTQIPPWLYKSVSALLAPNASPALAEVTINFPAPRFIELLSDLESGPMGLLDSALVAHTACPCMRWRFNSINDDAHGEVLRDFIPVLQRWLPRVYARGRLFVE